MICCVPGSSPEPPPFWKVRRPWGRGWTSNGYSKRILSNYDIKVALKPYQTIGSLFPKPQDPVPKDQTRGAIYSIPCQNCDKSYIGETKRKFASRLKKHGNAVEHKQPQKSALAEHSLRFGHSISWKSSKISRTSANWRNRRLLELWEINICKESTQ